MDDFNSDQFDDTATAVNTIAPPGAATDRDCESTEWDGPRCEKCAEPLPAGVVTICRSCGWYASLGTFVEVDPDWETATSSSEQAEESQQPSHLRVWFELLPRWSWVMIGCVAAIIIESVAVRLLTKEGSTLRTNWSLMQLGVGALSAVVCHLINFLVLATEDSDFGVLDIALRPLKLWVRALEQMPDRLWIANTAVCGVVAAVMSPLVIGGLPYERFWDWGFQAPVKQELMGAVMDRVKKLDNGSGSDNLEDAVGDFAGNADELADDKEELKKTPAAPRQRADCVILGYQTDREGKLDSLVLGTNNLGRLVFACRVRPELPPREMDELMEKLKAARSNRPLIAIQSDSAQWVKPHYACRVSFTKRGNGRLYEVKWDAMLGPIGAGRN